VLWLAVEAGDGEGGGIARQPSAIAESGTLEMRVLAR
jgi:hypothetical protein